MGHLKVCGTDGAAVKCRPPSLSHSLSRKNAVNMPPPKVGPSPRWPLSYALPAAAAALLQPPHAAAATNMLAAQESALQRHQSERKKRRQQKSHREGRAGGRAGGMAVAGQWIRKEVGGRRESRCAAEADKSIPKGRLIRAYAPLAIDTHQWYFDCMLRKRKYCPLPTHPVRPEGGG